MIGVDWFKCTCGIIYRFGEKCPRCGISVGNKCDSCAGTGVVQKFVQNNWIETVCEKCHGSGRLPEFTPAIVN